MQSQLLIILQNAAFVGVAIFWIYIASFIARIVDLQHFRTDDEIGIKGNLALALRRGGLYLGTGIGLLGPLLGPTKSFSGEFTAMVWEGALVTIFMIITGKINDAIVLPHVNNSKAIANNNVAVGLVECGGYIATGLITLGSFAGEGGGAMSAIVFFVLGQAALLIAVRIYEKCAGYKVREVICSDNKAAGLLLGVIMVSLGIILKSSIMGPFTGWASDIKSFALYAVLGMLVLYLVEQIVDLIFLPNTRIRELVLKGNVAAIVLISGVLLASAMLVAVAIV